MMKWGKGQEGQPRTARDSKDRLVIARNKTVVMLRNAAQCCEMLRNDKASYLLVPTIHPLFLCRVIMRRQRH